MEHTSGPRSAYRCQQKHLHVRGAYGGRRARSPHEGETSPRAWSIRCEDYMQALKRRNISTCVEHTAFCGAVKDYFRNISTCVEHTVGLPVLSAGDRKHLHVRGAYYASLYLGNDVEETSPRAWSIHLTVLRKRYSGRNISTCVEHTLHDHSGGVAYRKHLHVRGAYTSFGLRKQLERETSPRAWSIRTFRGR